MQPVIEIENGVPRHPLYRMKEPVNFRMERGEHLALVGPNGGGKSLLVDILTGRWPLLMNEVKYDFGPSSSRLVCDNIKYITFRDSYGDADGTHYYQQRWNSQDMETTPLVGALMPYAKDEEWKERLFDIFGIRPLLDKHIVLLSSGFAGKSEGLDIGQSLYRAGCPDTRLVEGVVADLDSEDSFASHPDALA